MILWVVGWGRGPVPRACVAPERSAEGAYNDPVGGRVGERAGKAQPAWRLNAAPSGAYNKASLERGTVGNAARMAYHGRAGFTGNQPATDRECTVMTKARARERKKARLAKRQAAASAPHDAHDQGANPTPADLIEDKSHPGKFDAKAPPGGAKKNTGGKNVPNLAATTRGSARSR